ncbi:conjugative transfer signal peptidase TraF [Methylobacter svalbardensis]|uniref:conjugative transfer signal peptidase TraF n=1 Tax=Methylobacter svalbardensis TaxID=3080016 RepID=UPI0030EDA247
MKRFTVCFGVAMSAFILSGLAYAVGIRLNTTPSIPVGVYRLTNVPIVKGAYVLFCPPPAAVFDMAKARGYLGAGYCPGGYGHMMKKILAVQDDVVSIGTDGVQINGQLLSLSAPIKLDGSGRPLPNYKASWVLDSTEVLVMSDSNRGSFDGRYFGPIQRSQIEGVIRPIFTW